MRYRAPHRSCGECWADADRAGNHPRCCQRNVPALRVGKSVPRLFKNGRVHLSAVRKGRSAARVVSLACRAAAGHGLQKTEWRLVQLAPPQTLAVRKVSPEKLEARRITARINRMPKHRMRGMKQSVPKSVDEYIAAQSEVLRPKLEQVRAAIRRAVPEAVEGIGYRMPRYKLHGKPMLYFAGFKEHYSLFAASGTFFAALEDELRGYELRKGTVKFPLTKPVPVKLIDRIAKLRAAGIAATAKKTLPGREKEGRK